MGLILMLMTIGGLVVAGGMLAAAIYTRKVWLATFAIGGTLIWLGAYAVTLTGTSMLSQSTLLARDEPKEFCGFYLDCHMHTSVVGTRRTRTIGDRTAEGEFYVVTVKVFSDAGRASLGLLAVDAHVVDAGGNKYTRDMAAESELDPQPAFETVVGPEEGFTKEIVFDLPAAVRGPQLDIKEGLAIDNFLEAFLIGDEDSLLHKRTYFDISEQNAVAGVK